MNCKQSWCRTQSTTHSVRIRRKWSTTLAIWSTSNCARPLQECNAPFAYLIGQKALKIVLVEFAWVALKPCLSWIENDLMPCRFRATRLKRDAFTEPDMEKSEEQTYYHQAFNGWKRCRRKKDATSQNDTEIPERCLKDPQYRQSQEEIGRDEAKVWRDGQISTRRSLTHVDEDRALPLCIKLEHSTQEVGKKRSDGHSTRL